MKIIIASDHAGYSTKSYLYQNLRLADGIEVRDHIVLDLSQSYLHYTQLNKFVHLKINILHQ